MFKNILFILKIFIYIFKIKYYDDKYEKLIIQFLYFYH